MMTLERAGDVFVLNLGEDENRFHPASAVELSEAIREVSAAAGPRALVTTGTGKFWSNGLDLDWMRGSSAGESTAFVRDVQTLLASVLVMPVPTVAAVQGHAFAAGAMLALAHDTRLMRADRGFLCLPEIDIDIPFTPGMTALIQSRLPAQTAHAAMTTGRRYTGSDALAAGLVDATSSADGLLAEAVEAAGRLAKTAGTTLGTIKAQMYGAAVESLTNGPVTLPGLHAGT